MQNLVQDVLGHYLTPNVQDVVKLYLHNWFRTPFFLQTLSAMVDLTGRDF